MTTTSTARQTTTSTARHTITHEPYKAVCSCGREFRGRVRNGNDGQRVINLARANARRHADAANAKIDA